MAGREPAPQNDTDSRGACPQADGRRRLATRTSSREWLRACQCP